MTSRSKFRLTGLVLLLALPYVILKLLSFTGRKPERTGVPDRLPGCPDSPNCVCSEDPRESHTVAPLTFEGDPANAWSRLRRVLIAEGGREVRSSETYVWFEFRTPLIRFVDDVECRLNADARQIEIRSASRAGYSDLGANRKRVARIRAAFEAAATSPE